MRWIPLTPSKVAYPPLLHLAALAVHSFQYLINQCGLLGGTDSIHNQCEDSGPDLSRPRKLSVIFFSSKMAHSTWRNDVMHTCHILAPCILPSIIISNLHSLFIFRDFEFISLAFHIKSLSPGLVKAIQLSYGSWVGHMTHDNTHQV